MARNKRWQFSNAETSHPLPNTVFLKTSFFSKHQFACTCHLLTELKHPNLSGATTHIYLAHFTAFFLPLSPTKKTITYNKAQIIYNKVHLLRELRQQCDQCRKSNLSVIVRGPLKIFRLDRALASRPASEAVCHMLRRGLDGYKPRTLRLVTSDAWSSQNVDGG